MKTKTKSDIVCALFAAFIFLFALLFLVLPKKDFSETEKRFLAKSPEFSLEALGSGEFASDTEEYLADHVPLRSFLVGVDSYYELFRGNNGSAGVYRGRDGWLIEKPFDRENRFETNMARMTSFAERTELPAALVIVPEKGYICADKLPANALPYEDEAYLARAAELCGEAVQFIDLSEPFTELGNEHQLYYRTDHHWTSEGAYLAYAEICDALELDAVSASDFAAETTPGFYGTSWSTSLYTLTPPDDLTLLRSTKSGGAAEVTIEDRETTTAENMFFDDALGGYDKYTVFLDGNHPLVRIKTGNPGEKLLIVKDSFAHCLAPFLAENFSEIVMIDPRYYRKPLSELVGSEGFDRALFVYGMENIAESRDILLK